MLYFKQDLHIITLLAGQKGTVRFRPKTGIGVNVTKAMLFTHNLLKH